MSTISSCFDSLPDESLLEIFSHVPLNDLYKTGLVNNKWKDLTDLAYWDRIFTFTERIRISQNSFLFSSVQKLEKMITASNKINQNLIDSFFKRYQVLDITSQINFIRNIFCSIKEDDSRLQDFLCKIYNYPSCPRAARMKIVDYCKKMHKNVFERIKNEDTLHVDFHTVPKKINTFSLISPTSAIANKLLVHEKNTFKTGELVVIVDKGNFDLGKSSLFYGIIEGEKNPESKLWKVYLQIDADGTKHRLCLKEALEIGKLPIECDLPDFCADK